MMSRLSRSRASGGASPESIHGTLVTFRCAIECLASLIEGAERASRPAGSRFGSVGLRPEADRLRAAVALAEAVGLGRAGSGGAAGGGVGAEPGPGRQ